MKNDEETSGQYTIDTTSVDQSQVKQQQVVTE